MKINKHIQGIAEKLNLGQYYKEVLQKLWDNRNKEDMIILCLVHVSSSGMSRDFKVGFIDKGKLINISHLVAKVTGEKYTDSGAVRIKGCGMDMSFALTNEFYAYLEPKNSKQSSNMMRAVQRRTDF